MPNQPTTDPLPAPIRVAIIEDRREIREGITALINGTEGYRCVGSFGSMEEALAKLLPGMADVALVDIGLPELSGIEGVRLFKERQPVLLTLMFTVYEDDERIFQALCAGASGYLLKKTPPARLLECIKDAVEGGSPITPEVARRVITLFQTISPPPRSNYQLTPHETRLLKMLVEGHNFKTAAAELGLSINTISFHMRNVYEKLQVHSKSEAVAKALRQRLLD